MIYKGIMLPDHLRKEAEEYVKNVIDDLESQEKLNKLDTCAYYMLAGSFSTYCDAMDAVREAGLISLSSAGNKAVGPEFKIAKDSLTSCLRILQEIGATLRSRKSLKVLENDAQEEESPLAKFMRESAAMV